MLDTKKCFTLWQKEESWDDIAYPSDAAVVDYILNRKNVGFPSAKNQVVRDFIHALQQAFTHNNRAFIAHVIHYPIVIHYPTHTVLSLEEPVALNKLLIKNKQQLLENFDLIFNEAFKKHIIDYSLDNLMQWEDTFRLHDHPYRLIFTLYPEKDPDTQYSYYQAYITHLNTYIIPCQADCTPSVQRFACCVERDFQRIYGDLGQDMKAFFFRFKNAILKDDRKTAASMMKYPVDVAMPHMQILDNETDFLKFYDKIFTPLFKEKLKTKTLKSLGVGTVVGSNDNYDARIYYALNCPDESYEQCSAKDIKVIWISNEHIPAKKE